MRDRRKGSWSFLSFIIIMEVRGQMGLCNRCGRR